MRHLLSATAIAMLGLSGAALAQEATTPVTPPDAAAPATPAPEAPANTPAPAEPGAPVTSTTDMTDGQTTDAQTADAQTLEAAPGMILASQVQGLNLWTTEQPQGSSWDGMDTVAERPAEWKNIGGIQDIVLTTGGEVEGYVADVGGFLGIGTKRVLLEPAQLKLMHSGDEVYFATQFTADELKALPDFQEPVLNSGT